MALVVLGIVEQRLQAVLEVLNQGRTVTEVAARYGVARQTLQRWLGRYQTDGIGRAGGPVASPQVVSASDAGQGRGCGGGVAAGPHPLGAETLGVGARAARHRRESSVGVGDLAVSTPPWSGAGKETATSPVPSPFLNRDGFGWIRVSAHRPSPFLKSSSTGGPPAVPGVESESGRLSEPQMAWIEALVRVDADVAVWRPSDWERIVDDLIRSDPLGGTEHRSIAD